MQCNVMLTAWQLTAEFEPVTGGMFDTVRGERAVTINIEYCQRHLVSDTHELTLSASSCWEYPKFVFF